MSDKFMSDIITLPSSMHLKLEKYGIFLAQVQAHLNLLVRKLDETGERCKTLLIRQNRVQR